ncbi:hypothetical protein [Methylobacter tundripaludum]|uniref:Uncharacterized protein n=1 Tax=Methylobacter tundripaludum (strain ATCC BAA-1195 / DSM 17260 / SV96) TaxID=697282 RepID=G3IU61_METTV|nr:hypothetical protein [Methylobacter tundripaludum]EGW22659.1 hypothetical protein Mettu_1483 [Methylobacter tundripaludum SV96]
MKKISDNPATDRQKVSITERNLLVAHGQSKKLADMRKKLQPDFPVEAGALPGKQLSAGLKPEVATELNKARKLIDDRINEIMRSFPEGKKNRLFSLRFGSVDALKTMNIKAAFKTLGIDDNLVKMKLIAALDFQVKDVKAH